MTKVECTHKGNHGTERSIFRPIKKSFGIGILFLCFVLFIAWICFFHKIPLEISSETTFITEPRTLDGKQVDYIRAIELENYPSNMKTDENGFRIVVRSLGVELLSEHSPPYVHQMYKKLGLDPLISPKMTLKNALEFLVEQHSQASDLNKLSEEELLDHFGKRLSVAMGCSKPSADSIELKIHQPWTLHELPIMSVWLKENGPVIDLVSTAVRKPNFCIPLTRTDHDIYYSPFSATSSMAFRTLEPFAWALMVRANFRIGTGDIDGAIDDILAIKILGRQIGLASYEVKYLGTLQEEIADSIGIAGSDQHQPTETQLKRLFDTLTDTTGERLPPRISDKKIDLYRRYSCLDAVQKMAWGTSKQKKAVLQSIDAKLPPTFRYNDFVSLKYNWNLVAQRVNENHDNPTRFNAIDISHLRFTDMLLPSSRSKVLGDLLSKGNFCADSIGWAKESCAQAASIDRLKAVTLAMLIYEKQHGHLPPAWSVDANGKPLHSWRVLLLPYLGQNELYEKIKLDEPWNSKYNRRFHNAKIPFYQCPRVELNQGETTYLVAVGDQAAFGGGKGKTLAELGPNAAKLVLVFESQTPVCWMDPTSELTETTDPERIKKHYLDPKANVGLRDGSVIFHARPVFPCCPYWTPEYFWTTEEK